MPSMMTLDEEIRYKAKAIYLGGTGHRIRAFWNRLMVTELGEFFCLHPHVWPNTNRRDS